MLNTLFTHNTCSLISAFDINSICLLFQFHFLYFISFAVIILGLAIYSTTPTRPALSEDGDNSETSPEVSTGENNSTECEILPDGKSNSAISQVSTVH